MTQEAYKPPYRITPAVLGLVEELGETLGRIRAATIPAAPQLRRANQIRGIQASLAIEGNTLSLEQVTAVIDGRRVLGTPREIQEVRNAFVAYEHLADWSPHSCDDLLDAHGMLMAGLVDEPGRFRSGGVGIQRGDAIIHVAPPADRVPGLVNALLAWLGTTPEHPIIASSIFHYEFEFIHPFQDGNGRVGRLWQTLILSRWRPVFALIPVESVIRDRQAEYYDSLARADEQADATGFVEFMLAAMLQATRELAVATDHVGDYVTDQVKRLLQALVRVPRAAADLMAELGLSHRPTFRSNYLHPALEAGWIEMTRPDAPRARNQKYRLTPRGRQLTDKEA